MKSLSSTLKDLISKEHKKTLRQLLTEVLKDHLSSITEPQMKQTIESYLRYLQNAPLGKLVNGGFDWPQGISDELFEMLNYVLTREQAILAAPDPILLDSLNIVAGQGFSAQSLFEQNCRLEKSLKNNQIATHQMKTVDNQITAWGAQLYDKFAEMILDASNENDLTNRFNAAFVASTCADLNTMTLVYQRLLDTFNHMKKTDFFKDFYDNKQLHDKYDFMFDYCEFINQNHEATTELRAVAEHLYDYIPLKAYQSCQKKRSALVSDTIQSLTVEDVFTKLAAWSSRRWQQHKDRGVATALLDELNNMLRDDQRNLEAWEKIEAFVSQKPQKKAAYEIFAYRFTTSDPNADPHTLLKELQPVVEVPSAPENIVVVPSSSELIALASFLKWSENQEKEGDDCLPIQPSFTPAADGVGIVRPGNPLAGVLDNSPSLTELFCDENFTSRKTTSKSGSNP